MCHLSGIECGFIHAVIREKLTKIVAISCLRQFRIMFFGLYISEKLLYHGPKYSVCAGYTSAMRLLLVALEFVHVDCAELLFAFLYRGLRELLTCAELFVKQRGNTYKAIGINKIN